VPPALKHLSAASGNSKFINKLNQGKSGASRPANRNAAKQPSSQHTAVKGTSIGGTTKLGAAAAGAARNAKLGTKPAAAGPAAGKIGAATAAKPAVTPSPAALAAAKKDEAEKRRVKQLEAAGSPGKARTQ